MREAGEFARSEIEARIQVSFDSINKLAMKSMSEAKYEIMCKSQVDVKLPNISRTIDTIGFEAEFMLNAGLKLTT